MLFRLNDHELYGIFVFNVRDVLLKSRLGLPTYSLADDAVCFSEDFTLDLFDLLGKARPEDEDDVFVIRTEFNGRKQSFISGVVEEIVDFDPDKFTRLVYTEELAEFGGATVNLDGRLVNVLDLQVFLNNYIAVNSNPYALNVVSNHKKVIVVDSNIQNRMVLREAFEQLGVSFFGFNDVVFAQKFISRLPDLGLTDEGLAERYVLIISSCLFRTFFIDAIPKLKNDLVSKNLFVVVHSSDVGVLSDSSFVDSALADFCPVKLRDIVLLRMSRL